MNDDLRQRIADRLRGWLRPSDLDAAVHAVNALFRRETAKLRTEAGNAARSRDHWHRRGLEAIRARTEAEAALDRVRALHQHNETAGYCDLCSNHGDITWPCATIRALDEAAPTPVAESAPCAECGHPKEQHSEADELVSVGQCQQCVADGNEGDAWHDYETPKGA